MIGPLPKPPEGSFGKLYQLSRNGNIRRLRELLNRFDCSSIINEKNEDGWTPLHIASEKGHIEIVYELLEKGANIEATDNVSIDMIREYV